MSLTIDDPAWKACAEWLCALGVLPQNHRVMMADAGIRDMAFALRDGVLLCYIVANLDPSSINMKAVNQRPQMAQFLCLKNIRIFLTSCKASFGLRDSDLFEPSMLYDFTDFARVLHTLSELSRSSKVKAARPDVKPWTVTKADKETEVIYRGLETLANDDETYQEFYYKHHGGSSNYGYVWTGPASATGGAAAIPEDGAMGGGGLELRRGGAAGGPASRRENYASLFHYYADEDKEEDIYADLCLLRKHSSTATAAAHHRLSTQSAAARLAEWVFEPEKKREHCLKELVETEANYVDVLNMLRKNFLRPITHIKDNDKKAIFINIKELGDLHAAFFTGLLDCVMAKPTAHRFVGDVFLEFKEKVKY